MLDLKKDLQIASAAIKGEAKGEFNFIYSRSNESLDTLFEHIDVADKEVLSVLGSSDYVFSAYDKGAKNVDAFDINSLSYRYFYLRKWLMKYKLIDAATLRTKDLVNYLKRVVPINKEEAETLEFWRKTVRKIQDEYPYSSSLFEWTDNPRTDYSIMSKKEANKLELIFILFDLFGKLDNVFTKKYDTIFISNILDCSENDTSKINRACENLKALINLKGEVIGCNLYNMIDMKSQNEIFSEHFEYVELFSEEYSSFGANKNTYYKYIRK